MAGFQVITYGRFWVITEGSFGNLLRAIVKHSLQGTSLNDLEAVREISSAAMEGICLRTTRILSTA
jgi:hypothetical protein